MTNQISKRLLDIVCAVSLLILFIPIWIIVPILIKLDSPGPILYTQKRIGSHRRSFLILKFRSMITNADEYILKHPSLWKKFQESDWKLENDPRITKLGRWLRRLTIDEMPQIFNVLKGDMSLVGPRAYRPEEIKYQLKKHPDLKLPINQLLEVKPGITGPWQTSGRNDIGFRQRAKLDAEYPKNWSLKKDLIIISKTPLAMITRW